QHGLADLARHGGLPAECAASIGIEIRPASTRAPMRTPGFRPSAKPFQRAPICRTPGSGASIDRGRTAYREGRPMPPQPDFWNARYSRVDRALAQMPLRVDGHIAWGNVRVAHCDTGYTRHPALGFPATATGESPWVKRDLGRDFFDGRTDPKDPLIQTPWQPPGHGTRTASALTGDDAQ